MSNFTRWYRVGSANATAGSKAVTGSGTYWKDDGVTPGDLIQFTENGSFFEIASVNSNTSITLGTNYTGSTISGADYAIVRNFTATTPSRIAAQAADLLTDFRKYIDTDMQKLNGKSAYEVAVDNGYVGTEAQWVDYLRNGGGFTDLMNRTDILTHHNNITHNATPRGKNLGTAITAAQIANIQNGSFNDLHVCDHWVFPIDGTITAYIVGCNLLYNMHDEAYNYNHIVLWLQNDNWKFPINDTATTAGGLLNSKLMTDTFPALISELESVIPAANIREHYDNVGDAVDETTGLTNHFSATQVKMLLPSYFNLFGMHQGLVSSQENHSTSYAYASHVYWPLAFFYRSVFIPMWKTCWLDSPRNTTQWNIRNLRGNQTSGKNANATDVCCWPYIVVG